MNNPTIVGTYWGNMTDITFRPVVIINNPETVEKVRFAVWTTGDQSDLKWYDANYNGIVPDQLVEPVLPFQQESVI